jgi:hypothetical protein
MSRKDRNRRDPGSETVIARTTYRTGARRPTFGSETTLIAELQIRIQEANLLVLLILRIHIHDNV